MKKIWWLFLILILGISLLFLPFENGQTQVQKSVDLKTALERFKTDKAFANASWGIYAYNLSTGKVEISHNENLSLIPASSLKILACGNALHRLGSDFQFETKLAIQGKKEGTLLKGNLVLIGSGDPTLGTDRVTGGLNIDALLKQWANAVKNQGIHKIDGNIIVDCSALSPDAVLPNWLWSDIGNYYGSGLYAVNIRENHYGIIFSSGAKPGDSTKIRYTFPKMPQLTIENAVLTGEIGSNDNAYIYGSPESNFRRVTGTIPPNQSAFEVRGALPNPPYQAARFLQETLTAFGISITGKILVAHQKQKVDQVINVVKSPKLFNIVYTTLALSHNLMAEALLQIAGKPNDSAATLFKGLEIMKKTLEEGKFDLNGYFQSDGSGLSRTNLITCKQMVEALKLFSKLKIGSDFENCLPVLGESNAFGTLNRLITHKGKIKMKSGYMARVRSYAGYAYNSKNEKIAFAFIVNYYTCNSMEALYKMAPVIDALAN